jgi:hypothetical protein
MRGLKQFVEIFAGGGVAKFCRAGGGFIQISPPANFSLLKFSSLTVRRSIYVIFVPVVVPGLSFVSGVVFVSAVGFKGNFSFVLFRFSDLR